MCQKDTTYWGDCIMASFPPPSPQLHSICGIEVELLALTGAKHVVHSLRVGLISPSLLPALRGGERIVLELWGHYCDTEEEEELKMGTEVGGQTWRICISPGRCWRG